jgi:uncharacterized protein YecE (DUF72 family)
MIERVTADFVYVRLHGSRELYTSEYSDLELDDWAERITALRSEKMPTESGTQRTHGVRRRDVYAYFDNDGEAHAPHDAIRLARRLGVRASAS